MASSVRCGEFRDRFRLRAKGYGAAGYPRSIPVDWDESRRRSHSIVSRDPSYDELGTEAPTSARSHPPMRSARTARSMTERTNQAEGRSHARAEIDLHASVDWSIHA